MFTLPTVQRRNRSPERESNLSKVTQQVSPKPRINGRDPVSYSSVLLPGLPSREVRLAKYALRYGGTQNAKTRKWGVVLSVFYSVQWFPNQPCSAPSEAFEVPSSELWDGAQTSEFLKGSLNPERCSRKKGRTPELLP